MGWDGDSDQLTLPCVVSLGAPALFSHGLFCVFFSVKPHTNGTCSHSIHASFTASSVFVPQLLGYWQRAFSDHVIASINCLLFRENVHSKRTLVGL